jgi:hypothetical protein
MSTIWTPSGEYVPKAEPQAQQKGPVSPPREFDGPGYQPTREEAEAALEQAVAMLSVPVIEQIVGTATGLFELAALHLEREAVTGEPPDLAEASLAIDALAALVEGLGARLGQYEAPLREAVSQLRMAFVRASNAPGPDPVR